jgi:hypothetical protein
MNTLAVYGEHDHGEPDCGDSQRDQDPAKSHYVTRAMEDGRLDKVIDEHTRYMKETNCEIWNL